MTNDKSDTNAPRPEDELARLLVEQKLATSEEIETCLQQASTPGGEAFEDIMVGRAVVTLNQLARAKVTLEASRGQQIPGYQIIAKLGSGAMATVFKARQLSLDRMVAIKVLPRKLSESTDYVERFYREGKAAAKLNHANIVQAIDVGEAGGFHYFVMEYVEGHTLYDELQANKGFGEADAMRVILQIARALEHAHSQGFIHRDVKPKNIMIAPDGNAKLADMGLARAAEDVQAAQAEAGKAFGTPYYISPEQIRGEVDIDFRADIYSLGATLYHVVTGRVPFDAPTPAGVMHRHLKDPLVPPDHINTELSAGMGEIVEVMMAKERKRRYASTSDLIVDLEAVASGQPPLQAHKQLDTSVLTMLEGGDVEVVPQVVATPRGPQSNLLTYLVIVAALLAASLVLNFFLLLGD
jgi:eukaryotic-like serine/threonine-protein kinase